MIRIVALNDEEQVDTSEQEEVVATKEAQEAIAESEYIRAIKLKAEGQSELALSILEQLLETQVINEGNNVEKLMYIKYNCHKNIAVILEERCEYEKALQNYIAAVLIDNSDVYTLHRFGQLALKMNSNDLAEYAFENCLGNNAAHWRAAEGMLNALNYNHNVLGSYNTALQICRNQGYPSSKAAMQVLGGIVNWFSSDFKIFEQSGDTSTFEKYSKGNVEDSEGNFNLLENKLFTKKDAVNDIEMQDVAGEVNFADFPNLTMKSRSWLSVGQYILQLYEFIKEKKYDLFLSFYFNDILQDNSPSSTAPGDQPINESTTTNDEEKLDTNDMEVDQNKPLPSNENTDIPTVADSTNDNNNEDSDSNNESNRNKARRRCSDLHFLEQWGWHKNRRYSSRKKAEKEETDDSLNFYLRRTFSKYMKDISGGKWPFNEVNENSNEENITHFQCTNCQNSQKSEESFEKATETEFERFLEKLKELKIDLMLLIFKWLKYVSLFWHLPLPDQLKSVYLDIFNLYIQHYDLSSWNQLTPNNYESSFRICLLYLELSTKANRELFEDLSGTRKIYHHLCFNIGNCKTFVSQESQNIFELRLIYMRYLIFCEKSLYNECLTTLEDMLEILQNCDCPLSFVLHLPNSEICLNQPLITKIKKQYKSQIDISNIPKFFNKELWSELKELIISNLQTLQNNYQDDNWLKDTLTMLEILLQSLWRMSSYEDCLKWSEKCLHFAVSYYLEETKSLTRQKMWAEFINFSTSYIEAIILNEGFDFVEHLDNDDKLSRMIQNVIRLLVYQFDGNFEKNSTHASDLDFKRSWLILHQIILREEENKAAPSQSNTTNETAATETAEDVNDAMPSSFLLLFTAHEHLGRRQWCSNDNGEFLQYILDAVVPNLKTPIYDMCRDVIYEYLEQVTFCLFKYPQKKARSKHLEDHEAQPVKLTWSRSIQIFDLYKPEQLPEFNSFKGESINSDMEQMLIKIISLLPKDLDPSSYTSNVTSFIEGQSDKNPLELGASLLPYKIINLYYLMADFYFKSRDFIKAIKFYTLDLVVNPARFDSWAGMALSKASQIETKLNSLEQLGFEALWEECEQVLRCFECCINLNRYQTLLWIEYGSFCYIIHSYLSRYSKYATEQQSLDAIRQVLEERRTKLLNIAQQCFSVTNSLQNSQTVSADESNDSNDEKWLCQYMLGKISEKRQEEPKQYLNHYLLAANYLYECNATYPIKINHSNPTTLSVEALEIFYRVNAAIIKYISREQNISRSNGVLFNKVLRNLANSPFAFNKAKIDGNILKRKIEEKNQILTAASSATNNANIGKNMDTTNVTEVANKQQVSVTSEKEKPATVVNRKSTSRRNSQESSLSLARSSSTSTVISSESSSGAESESDTDTTTDTTKKAQRNDSALYSPEELKNIYRMVIQNIEECATRFPEHYKSLYRLIQYYINTSPEQANLEICEQLLMGQYKTTLGNVIYGLFYERKNNNLFNGIWRIPSSEIDRPGSFSTYLVKCVNIFIKLLAKVKNHKTLIDVALNLYKTPDVDKRYIADAARKDLYQQSISYTVQIFRDVLEKNQKQRSDSELMELLLDIYSIHKKCVKYMNQKEPTFTKLLTDVYLFFIEDKVECVPENYNILDLAIKLCLQELTSRKLTETRNAANPLAIVQQSTIPPRTYYNIPGLKNRNPKTTLPPLPSTSHMPDISTLSQFNPLLLSSLTDNQTADFLLLQRYYANLLEQQQQKKSSNVPIHMDNIETKPIVPYTNFQQIKVSTSIAQQSYAPTPITTSIKAFEQKTNFSSSESNELMPANNDTSVPPKTLQQKLAERQKSYQLQAAAAATSAAATSPITPKSISEKPNTSEDVIILD